MELALYEEAGLPAPEVRKIATIDGAGFMAQHAGDGSIAVGKEADLAINQQNPAERTVDLCFVENLLGRRQAIPDGELARDVPMARAAVVGSAHS